MIEDKVTLARLRAELIEKLGSATSPEKRVHLQGELSITNAKIKALNTTDAARAKAAADRKKIAGLAEAQANAARARANVGLPAEDDNANDDPAQIKAIDAWIATVFADSGVKVRRTRNGLDFGDVPVKWLMIFQRLCTGIHAAARGEELPDEDVEAEPAPKAKKRP